MAFTLWKSFFKFFLVVRSVKIEQLFSGGYSLNGSRVKLIRRQGFDSPTTHTI